MLGGADDEQVLRLLARSLARAERGIAPEVQPPDPDVAAAAVRVAIDYRDADDLRTALARLLAGWRDQAALRRLRARGVFVGRGPARRVAFLYPGQGAQYPNMLAQLNRDEPVVAQAFAAADRVMRAWLGGRDLSSFIFADTSQPHDLAALADGLRRTDITQPAVLAADLALTRLLRAHGLTPDLVMGHSLGEYAALTVAGAFSASTAFHAVAVRSREMVRAAGADPGAMAVVAGDLQRIERVRRSCPGYLVVATINSTRQVVLGGTTAAVEAALPRFRDAGLIALQMPVSHAFHTAIVAPAAEPLVAQLSRREIRPPRLPAVANATGELYPATGGAPAVLDLLGRQVGAPVQFVRGLETLYEQGARVFVEVGPGRALHGFVADVLGAQHDDVLALHTNEAGIPDDVAVNRALCGLYAAGHGYGQPDPPPIGEDPWMDHDPRPLRCRSHHAADCDRSSP